MVATCEAGAVLGPQADGRAAHCDLPPHRAGVPVRAGPLQRGAVGRATLFKRPTGLARPDDTRSTVGRPFKEVSACLAL